MKRTWNLMRKILRLVAPPPRLTVSEWADRHRILSSEYAAEPGKWRTSRAPYQKEIMDSFNDPEIYKIVVMSCAQVGKNEIINNVLGYFIDNDPCPILLVEPTIEMGEDISKTRLAPMFRDTAVLREKIADVKSRDSSNTILQKVFPGGRLAITGANSPVGLASRPIRIVLADEVDRYPDSAGKEGDPLSLAEKRTSNFWNYKIGEISTPLIKGASRIEKDYLLGTQEEWQSQCPNCGEYHYFYFKNFEYEHITHEGNNEKVHEVTAVLWVCPDCAFKFDETSMKTQPAKWVARNPGVTGIRSFKLNSFVSPWVSWPKIIKEWLDAKGDPESEKVFVNTRLGETYELKGDIEDETIFLNRREKYPAELPDGVLLLTAAVDVQDNRLEYEICGWGDGEECWGIRKGIVMGVPDNLATWQELDQQLDRTYRFANGVGLAVARTFIDSGGHYTKEVYQYCHQNMYKNRLAIKGVTGFGGALIHRYSPIKEYGIFLVLINVDSGKQYVFDRLKIETPGAKYFHFPQDQEIARGYDQIYFKGLIAERLVPEVKKNRAVLVWKNVSPDKKNEPLDLRVYNLACLHSINPDWETYKNLIYGGNPAKKILDTAPEKPDYGCIKRASIY